MLWHVAPWKATGVSQTPPFFLLYLCLDFPPVSILSCHRLKKLYLPANESSTYSQHTGRHSTSPFHPNPSNSFPINHRPLILLSRPLKIRIKSKFVPRPIRTYVMYLLLIPLCSCLLEAPASRAFLQLLTYSKLVCTLSSSHPLALYLGCFEQTTT